MNLLGFDIGGTKCAVIFGIGDKDNVEIISKKVIPTDHSISAYKMLDELCELAVDYPAPDRIGVSCGGPLDSKRGVILSPFNLPGWDDIHVTEYLENRFKVPCKLQNDANACALAEWRYGAGRGCENMIFLTFGTGLGAGLILNGRLYAGTNDNAGECGHIRLAEDGPVGFGKAGSFEGFCSGGGIAKLAQKYGEENPDCSFYGNYTAKQVAIAAKNGDKTAKAVFAESGKMLEKGLSVLIDILNPERIVIGSIFERSGDLMIDSMEKELDKEALGLARNVCEIVPAKLGDSIGDYAALITGAI